MPNRLVNQTSPYLLQHAHNPVHWWPWCTEAFDAARAENKPVLVSIGYSACHWCHVMERESFEDEATARYMNEHFINIKVDREERPDVDAIYMDAVQAISGSGGWPLNVFVTPEGKPFYGGTYFPPRRAYNRSSWAEVLAAIIDAYHNRHEAIQKDAQSLTAHLAQSALLLVQAGAGELLNKETIAKAVENINRLADKESGGFGAAPKFPQTGTISFLLQWAQRTGDGEALKLALLSLDKMIKGGIYDQLGGGFARYSTDREWLAPHFEKMLYDNALLISVLADAYRVTKDKKYATVISETVHFLERELMHPEGGFYAALDADSEGEEGRFYVWSFDEIVGVLDDEAPFFCAYYDVRPDGNWEGHNILRVLQPLMAVAARFGMTESEAKHLLYKNRQQLLAVRDKRVRPGLDDKILLNWNALTVTALCAAYAATAEEHYKTLALNALNFLETRLQHSGVWQHSWKEGGPVIPAFLDDLTFLTQAYLHFYRIDFETAYLEKAVILMQSVLKNYPLQHGPLLSYTSAQQTDILLHKPEIYDGATPAGNSIAALNLYQLSIYFNKPEWKERSVEMLRCIGDAVGKWPTSFSHWLVLAFELAYGTAEVVILGKDAEATAAQFSQTYLPHSVLMVSKVGDDRFPLLAGKKVGAETLIFLCENYVCRQPVSTLDALWPGLRGKYLSYMQ